jgi:hypothetical protein
MTNQHPITPPLELQDKWRQDWYKSKVKHIQLEDHIATQAARWGADQELEACYAWLRDEMRAPMEWSNGLHTARRPKPPSLKEQALLQLDTLNADLAMHGRGCDLSQIRRALEALPND